LRKGLNVASAFLSFPLFLAKAFGYCIMNTSWFQRHKLLIRSLLFLAYTGVTIWWLSGADENTNKIRMAGKVLLGLAALYFGIKSYRSWRKQLHPQQTEA
jgi:hypothetical protein